ncbi:two component transcriptional regulator, LytTR family [Epilithonimonas bovis DSM 19482]|jgi:DNA-binding LytR/AlgR family response regulator|uniref:Two component transcriptional regulator, LytTR family n=1 Tax=Epilithonimonas bovis DSM 19482 TaxID=1121284 RepID=A0A1U7PUS8_9FLAO|nr:LytTR family DNA-binding domain-containing protein [Epilithonimonas bovis]QIY85009.1 response regulator transcription factor [Chryseobacterium sp. NEB161]SIT95743.1 two component transcriptional regulator, LytTR family [Epilithonimonas bovis DSM 19482]
MKKIRCIIVEDQEIDRLMLQHLVKQQDILELVAAVDSAENAKALINDTVDLLFLDIDLPDCSGIEMRKMYQHVPACIFISSHPEYAVETFELDTLDFISKPLKKERFDYSVNKLADFFSMKEKSEYFDILTGSQFLNIKEGHETVQIKISDIIYLEALKDYTRLITAQKKHCVLSSIGQILKDRHFSTFVRIHKSYAVPKHLITRKNSYEVMISHNNISLPIGRAFKENLNFF